VTTYTYVCTCLLSIQPTERSASARLNAVSPRRKIMRAGDPDLHRWTSRAAPNTLGNGGSS